MNRNPLIFDIQKFSIHDGPGIRTIVFFKGCDLSCAWCANPESIQPYAQITYDRKRCIGCGNCIEACTQNCFGFESGKARLNRDLCNGCGKCADTCYANAIRLVGKFYTADEIMDEVMKDLPFYYSSGGGLTLSGGEALLYPEFASEIASKSKLRNISVAIETSGNIPWENIEMLMPFADIFLYDFKFYSEGKHERYCGHSNQRIKSNLEKLSNAVSRENIEIILRIPIIPEINDDCEEIEKIADYTAKLENIHEVHLLPYHNFGIGKYAGLGLDYELANIKLPEEKRMVALGKIFQANGLVVRIGGQQIPGGQT